MSDMMKLAKDGDTQTLAAYAKSLVLPNADNWFTVAFGATHGPGYAAASEQQRLGIVRSAPANFTVLLNGKKTRIDTHKFENSCDEDATAKEYPLLIKRDSLVPLYDVRFWDNTGAGSIWSYFAYVDGAFRYVGDFSGHIPAQAKKQPASANGQATTDATPRLKVGGNVAQAQLLHQVAPQYPLDAKKHHISGNVTFHAIIGKEVLHIRFVRRVREVPYKELLHFALLTVSGDRQADAGRPYGAYE